MLEFGVNPKHDFNQDVIGNAKEICPSDALFVFAVVVSPLIFSCNVEYVANMVTSKLTLNESKFMYDAGFMDVKSDVDTNATDVPPIATFLGV